MKILELEKVKKVYKTKNLETVALKNVSFSVEENEFISIMGESGSGKTTLLNVMSTLDNPTNGKVILNNVDLSSLKESEVAKFRREKLGFVFQDFNLLDIFSNKDNIFLPLVLSDYKNAEMEKRLDKIKSLLGIEEFLEKYPNEISGGQKQRIAVARALITNPSLILADEPTGALDSKSSNMLLDLFTKINKTGQTILMVTHSVKAASYSNRVIFIKDGVAFHEIYKGNESNEKFMQRISDSLTMLNNRGIDYEF